MIKNQYKDKKLNNAIRYQVDDANKRNLDQTVDQSSLDQSSILNDSQISNTSPLPAIYKKNIDLDPRFDLCLEKVTYKYFEKGIQNVLECNICKGDFNFKESCRRIISCKHLFHDECIKKYLKINDLKCPICNQIIDLNSITHEQLVCSKDSVEDNQNDR